jgi:hypothetical protein
VTLNRDVCVAYAGTADHSVDIIRGADPTFTAEAAVEYFHAVHTKASGSVDFIVGCASTCSLFSIREGRVEAAQQECWIGDRDAFDEYQRRELVARVPQGIPSEMEHFSRAIHAFMNVVQEREVPTVGGLAIRAGSTPEGWVYLDQALAYYPSQTIPSGVTTPLSFGGRAEGGFAYSLLVPRVAGIPVVAVHVFQGSLGFIYAPLRADKPIQLANVSHDDLRREVLQRFKVAVDGPKVG